MNQDKSDPSAKAFSAVIAADDTRLRAMMDHDLTTLQAVLADGLIYTHATGRRETKTQYLHSLRSGRVKYVDVHRNEVHMERFGCVALMFGSSTIRAVAQGEAKHMENVFQSVWVDTDGIWQMAAWTSVLRQDKQAIQRKDPT